MCKHVKEILRGISIRVIMCFRHFTAYTACTVCAAPVIDRVNRWKMNQHQSEYLFIKQKWKIQKQCDLHLITTFVIQKQFEKADGAESYITASDIALKRRGDLSELLFYKGGTISRLIANYFLDRGK